MTDVQMIHTDTFEELTINGFIKILCWECPTCGNMRFTNHDPSPCPNCKYGHLVTYTSGHTFDDDTQPVTAAESVTTRLCENCGVDISQRRHQTRTCSAKCRKAISRKAG